MGSFGIGNGALINPNISFDAIESLVLTQIRKMNLTPGIILKVTQEFALFKTLAKCARKGIIIKNPVRLSRLFSNLACVIYIAAHNIPWPFGCCQTAE